jgi:hypothetical protein
MATSVLMQLLKDVGHLQNHELTYADCCFAVHINECLVA